MSKSQKLVRINQGGPSRDRPSVHHLIRHEKEASECLLTLVFFNVKPPVHRFI